jgi:beta-lactamase class D
MKKTHLLITIILLSMAVIGCKSDKNKNNPEEDQLSPVEEQIVNDEILNQSVVPGIGDILDSNDVEGSVVIYNSQTETWVSNDYNWAEVRRLPASTFKIVNSIIGLETGVVSDMGIEFNWDGKPRRLKQWEKDFDLKGAFHASCVPCYQDLAHRIGTERMAKYLSRFDYGAMHIDSSSLDVFWLEGESGISQMEQIEFLRKFYYNELEIDSSVTQKMKSLMVIDSNSEYVLSGKTGWSIRNSNNNGWFVGYLEKGDDVYFFATNVNPQEEFNMKLFPKIRAGVTMEAFRLTGVVLR